MGRGWGRRRLLIAAVIAALVVVPAVLVVTQQRAASASTVLSILDGSASIARGTAAFAAASDGDIVNSGDRVQTADRGHALVTFFDGSTLEIEPATTVLIEEASSDLGGAIAIRIAQAIGRTWASVQHLSRADSKFELRTPTLTAAVRGTAFITEVLADGSSTLQTIDGLVQVTGQGRSVLVAAGQRTTVPPSAPPAAPAPAPPSPNRLRFGMHSPAYLAVVDPFGRACGIVLPGPTVVRQIPGCLASDPGTDPQLVDVPNAPVGTYQVVVASIAPGGAFVATASAVDGLGNLSFNYTADGTALPGAKLAAKIEVEAGPSGALTAKGFGPLVVIEHAPVKVVRAATAPRPSASGAPDTAAFPPLPGIGFATGSNTPLPAVLATAVPTLASAPAAAISPLPTLVLPTVTQIVPTLVQTAIPAVVPTPMPTMAPTQTVPRSPTPTPLPTPAPAPPTLSGGTAPAGGTLGVLGTGWIVGAAVVITWPDGTQIASADVQPDGRFATVIRVPQTAVAGSTHTITARGGGLTATAEVTVAYTPSLTLTATFPPRAGASVPYTGSGWPPNAAYSLTFDGVPVGTGGMTSALGTLAGSFTVPPNTPPGSHTVTATAAGYSASAALLTQ